jgi:hypothetical protein
LKKILRVGLRARKQIFLLVIYNSRSAGGGSSSDSRFLKDYLWSFMPGYLTPFNAILRICASVVKIIIEMMLHENLDLFCYTV